MAVVVKLSNASRVTSNQGEIIPDGIKISRSIYQQLGSLEKNRTMATRTWDEVLSKWSYEIHWDKLPQEYATFLVEMNYLYMHKFYPQIAVYRNIPVPTDTIIAIDEYLGTLGNGLEYHYTKDFVNITPWLSAGYLPEYRVLVDESDNTFLVDTSDNTVLVHYT